MKELVAKLEGLLRLRSIPFGMKLYESVAMMYFINGLQWSGYKRFDRK